MGWRVSWDALNLVINSSNDSCSLVPQPQITTFCICLVFLFVLNIVVLAIHKPVPTLSVSQGLLPKNILCSIVPYHVDFRGGTLGPKTTWKRYFLVYLVIVSITTCREIIYLETWECSLSSWAR